MERLYAANLTQLAPELTLVGFAVILTLIDLMMPKGQDRRVLGWISILGLAVSAAITISRLGNDSVSLLNDSYRLDDYANVFKLIFLFGAMFVTALAIHYIDEKEIPHHGEVYYLLLTATLGGMVMASSGDFITLFVGLELLSISSYILVGARKHHQKSNEAAFKYVVMGGVATAFTLYGMSFLYGITGTTNLRGIATGLSQAQGYDMIVYLAFFLMLAGFGFKLALAPFHMWAPDVYEGAPTPITAFLTAVSKGAAVALVFRVLLVSFSGARDFFGDMLFYLSVVAAISMIVGNTIALRQTNVKRLMAYSSIANAGYLLVPFTALTLQSFSQLVYYVIAYLIMNIGAFAVLTMVAKDQGSDELKAYGGLYHRAPWTAVGMTVIVLSLAGIPITAGFFGKFYILWSTIRYEKYWLAGTMIATSIISYYYYFGVIRQMFMRPGTDSKMRISPLVATVLWVTVLITIAMAVFPNEVLNYLASIFDYQKDLFGITK